MLSGAGKGICAKLRGALFVFILPLKAVFKFLLSFLQLYCQHIYRSVLFLAFGAVSELRLLISNKMNTVILFRGKRHV